MIILAVYYTLADIVLLGQCFYYRGFTLRDEASTPVTHTHDDTETHTPVATKATEQTALLPKTNGHSHQQSHVQDYASRDQQSASAQHQPISAQPDPRRHSAASFRDILHGSVDGTHLSPATPFIEPSTKEPRPARNISAIQTILFNACAVILVCAAGILGWYVSLGSRGKHSGHQPDSKDSALHLDPLGQTFGYLCAVFYLGSRLPQILLNFRRKSTDGVSLLFFLFACIGNLTYVLSILAYSPDCGRGFGKNGPRCEPGEASGLYSRYILVNFSWLLGSFGTLLLDMCIFTQFFLYKDSVEDEIRPCA